MSFRPLIRSPALQIARSNVRMMSDAPAELRTYVGFNVFKGKAAINVKPIGPTFKVTDRSRNLTREGTLFFEFAPVGANPREYDWTKKATFSMSATECGEICRLKEGASAEFTHDPNNNTPDAGKVTKRMKWTPTADGKGVFLSLAVNDKIDQNGSVMYTIPVTLAELEVLKSIMQFCIPRFLGIDKVF